MDCPYCNKKFKSWMSVRKHVSTCQKNDRTYVISLIYGPISYVDISNLSNRKFTESYPNLEDSIKSSINKRLRQLNLGTQKLYLTKAKDAVLSFYNINGRIPNSRDTYHNKDLPTDNWCKNHFGSWNKFIEECGLVPSIQNGYGINTKAEDGVYYRSSIEATFVNLYLHQKYSYEYEKPYPTGNRISDFYIQEKDLYIEVAGGLRPEVISEKIQYCIDNSLSLLVVYPNQILSGKVRI